LEQLVEIRHFQQFANIAAGIGQYDGLVDLGGTFAQQYQHPQCGAIECDEVLYADFDFMDGRIAEHFRIGLLEVPMDVEVEFVDEVDVPHLFVYSGADTHVIPFVVALSRRIEVTGAARQWR
jgi:hypothetical protein